MLFRIVVTVFGLLMLSGCGDGTEPAAGAPEVPTVLNRGLQAEPGTLDPHKSIMTAEWHVLRDLYEGLTVHGPAGDTAPGAAQSWTVSEDGLTYTFHLRPDLSWSDATPLTARDFVRGLRRLFDPETASPAATLANVIKNARAVNRGELAPEDLGVSAPDEMTVVVELERPAPVILHILAMPFAAPFPEARARDWQDVDGFSDRFLYNGAYQLKDRVPNEVIELTKNEAYHAAQGVSIEAVSYFPIQDTDTALRQYRAGGLHIHPWFPASRFQELKDNLGDEVLSAPGLGISYLVFNVSEPPFDDRNVRRALASVVDQKILAETVLAGSAGVATGFVPHSVNSYDAPDTLSLDALTPEMARALLAEAGYSADRPLSFDMRVRNTPEDRRVAVAVQGMWSSIGVEAGIINAGLNAHFDSLETGNFAAGDAGWALFDAPESFLFLLSSEDARNLNYGRYENSEFDAAYSAATASVSQSERMDLFRTAERIALEDAAVVPLYFYATRALVKPVVKGYEINPMGVMPTRHLSF